MGKAKIVCFFLAFIVEFYRIFYFVISTRARFFLDKHNKQTNKQEERRDSMLISNLPQKFRRNVSCVLFCFLKQIKLVLYGRCMQV